MRVVKQMSRQTRSNMMRSLLNIVLLSALTLLLGLGGLWTSPSRFTSEGPKHKETTQAKSKNGRIDEGQRAGDATTRKRVAESYGKLPLGFEINRGQADPDVT